MQVKILFRTYSVEGTTDSLERPTGHYIERFRLIADEGKCLTRDNETFVTVIDINKGDFLYWSEVDQPQLEETEENIEEVE